jgi:UDP-glucose 4-epimerase
LQTCRPRLLIMKVALTGVSGYLGQLILRLLDKHRGVESILGLDIAPCPFPSPKYAFETADMRTADFKTLLKDVDVLYHLAFVVEPPKGMTIKTIDEINIQGSKNVLRGALAAGVSKIIVASSIAAYGVHPDNPEVLTETSPLRPNADWYYSRAKGEIEAFLDALQEQHPETTIIRFRPSTFLGPSIRNPIGKQYLSRSLIGLKKGYRVDHCWDEDVAEAFVLALSYEKSDTFNLAGENPITLDDAARLLGKKMIYLNHGLVSFAVRIAAALGLVAPGLHDWVHVATRGSILVSANRAKEQLGWKPRFDSAGALLEFAKQKGILSGKEVQNQ